jgi:hypothetical protein
MARSLETILKEKGYSVEDLTALAPLLSNAKYRQDLEGVIADADYQAEVGRADSAEALRWRDEEALPLIQKQMEDARKAREEAASLRERMKALQEQGLLKIEQQVDPTPKPTAPSEFDPSKYKLITEDRLKSDVAQFADLEGDAIAAAHDLNEEYRDLFGGQTLYNYQGADGLKGLRALRKEAVAARKPIYDYVRTKFNFEAKRAERATAEAKAHDDAIRAEARASAIKEFAGDPLARPPQGSAFPMLPRPKSLPAEGKMPWDVGDRSKERVAAAVAHVLA